MRPGYHRNDWKDEENCVLQTEKRPTFAKYIARVCQNIAVIFYKRAARFGSSTIIIVTKKLVYFSLL
jgi:putative transposon-encoded protein